MWLALALIALQSGAGEDTAPIDGTPLHESTTLENFAVERDYEWHVAFRGSLHVWVTAVGFEPTLFVANESRRHRSKRGGGGSTPYLCIPAVEGDVWKIRVAAEDPSVVCTVHIVEAPDGVGDEELVVRGEAVIESLDIARGLGVSVDAFTELTKIASELTSSGRQNATWKQVDLAMRLTTVAERSSAAIDAVRTGEFALASAAQFLPASHPRILVTTQQLAAAQVQLGNLDRAHDLFVEVLEVRTATLPKDDLQVLFAKQNVAAILTELGRFNDALAMSSEVIAAFEAQLPLLHPNHLGAKINHAVMMGEVGDLRGAVALQEELLQAIEQHLPKTDHNLSVLRRNLADDLLELGFADRAFEVLTEILTALQPTNGSQEPATIDISVALGRTLIAKGEFESARAHFEELGRLCTELLPPGSPMALDVMSCLGGIQFETGDFEGAAATFESVLDTQSSTLDTEHLTVLATRMNLAQAMAACGDLEKARAIEEAVCRSYEDNHPHATDELLAARVNLAGTRAQLGDVDGAIVLMEHALQSAEGRIAPSHPVVLRLKFNLAGQLGRVQQSDRALELTEYVLQERERTLPPDNLELASSRMAYAGLLSKAGRFDEASEHLTRAYATYERAGLTANPDAVRCHANIGLNLYRSGRLDEAREILLRAEQLKEEAGGAVDIDRLEIALALAAIEYSEKAWPELQSRLNLLLDLERRSASRLLSEPVRVARSTARAEIVRLGDVIQMVQSLPSDARNELMDSLFWTLEEIRAVAVEQPRVVRELRANAATRVLFEQLTGAGAELAAATRMRPTDGGNAIAWQARLLALTEQRDAIERELRALGMPDGSEAIAAVRAAVGSLAVDEAIVTTIRHQRTTGEHGLPESTIVRNDSLSCFVLTGGGAVRCIEIGSIGDIEQRVEAWRSSVGAPVEPRGFGTRARAPVASEIQHEAGVALRALVLDPICAALPGVTNLSIILDDVLHLVPFDALPAGDGLVGDSLRIEVLPSLYGLTRSEHSRPTGKVLVLGGIDYQLPSVAESSVAPAPSADRHAAAFEPLDGALAEVELIGRLANGFDDDDVLVVRGQDANKRRLVKEASAVRFLHVATHGWFEAQQPAIDAERSDTQALALLNELAPETLCGIALAGANHGPEGILTAEELATLDLSNCELAVLSACETNVGIRRAGQGIQSLQTALHAAGARTAITSLWKVDDAATRRLFELFYTKLWSEKLGPADALWQAKMALRAEGHPTRDWAGWVLTGDPD